MGTLPFPRRRLRRPIAFTRLAALLAAGHGGRQGRSPHSAGRRAEGALDDVAVRGHARPPAPVRRRAGLPEAPVRPARPPDAGARLRHLVVAELGGKIVSFPDDPGATGPTSPSTWPGPAAGSGALRARVPSPVRGEPPGLPLLRARGRQARRHARLAVHGGPGRPAADRPGERGGPHHLALGGPQRRLPRVRPRRPALHLHRRRRRPPRRPTRSRPGRTSATCSPRSCGSTSITATRGGPTASRPTTRSSRSPAHGRRSGPTACATPGG